MKDMHSLDEDFIFELTLSQGVFFRKMAVVFHPICVENQHFLERSEGLDGTRPIAFQGLM